MIKRHTGIIVLLLLALPFLGSSLTAQAQDLQIGYTHQEALLQNMPEFENVQRQLQQELQQEQQELQQEQQELQQMVEQYQEQQELLSEERRAEREQEIRERQQELQMSMQQRDQELSEREQELMQPLMEKLQGTIQEVAEEQGLDLVVRSQALLYANGNIVDITEEVAQRLGIEVQEGDTTPVSNN